jgi:6-pyruvoyl-tetrahydropterin synthase
MISAQNGFVTELILNFDLFASHSLDTREELHEHLWKVELVFSGEPIRGRIIDLPLLEKSIEEFFRPYQKTSLNAHPDLDDSARAFPTCETLGESFFSRIETAVITPLRASVNPTLALLSIQITLAELDGRLYGSARIRRRPH